MDKSTPPVCSYEGSDYQQCFWDEGQRDYEDAAEAIALKRLLPEKGSLLLELGAGAGRNTPRYHSYKRVVLLDYSRSQLEQAQKRLGDEGRYIYVAADVYRLPFVGGLFDGGTMIRTLHHMAEPEFALSQVRRVMASDGIFILEFANKRNLKAMLRYLLGKQSWSPYTQEPVEFTELNFDFHPKAIRRYLREVGFEIEKQLTVSHFRVGFLKRHIPTRILASMDSFLQWTGSFIQVSPSVFSRCRAVGNDEAALEDGFFQCPSCGEALPGQGHNLHCESCGAAWEYRDGIYDFRVKKR
ncbi:MAG: class I SAM-dependent methyltransferase [Chloroflexota bacterium]|jgi:ubiquinone/menaquinone biosynthesis C-methylase UbiE|nr:class I SAM-dependent methyltransferase [Chloroflexota bacterium]